MDNFLTALGFVLKWEGKFSDNPADPGGRTMEGITQNVYDAWRRIQNLPLNDVKNISDDELKAIYNHDYWTAGKCDQMKGKLAVVHFNACVNCGPAQAAQFLQSALGVIIDGNIGPITLSALWTSDQDEIAGKAIDLLETFYKNLCIQKPALGIFLNGWLARTADLRVFIEGMG